MNIPAITSKEYFYGLVESWNHDKLKSLSIYVGSADQGDLER